MRITLKINFSRLLRDYFFKGERGTYGNFVCFENKDGPDQYGNTHFVCQDLGKEARERGEKGPIVGNLKVWDAPNSTRTPDVSRNAPQNQTVDDDDVPF